MQQHDVDDTMTRKSNLEKAYPPNTPGARELKMTFNSRPQQWRTIVKDWEKKCVAVTKQQRCVHKDMLHQPLNTNSLRDDTMHMVFEGESAVKLHAKNVEVWTSANGNPRQERSHDGESSQS